MASLQQKNQEEGICPICQERLTEAVSTDCGHLFCQLCLAQHVERASASGVFRCPLCRKPCSEGVLGAGHVCHSHGKKLCWFCEERRLLLCVECLMSPEHKAHRELAIEDAISHYKERLSRRSRKLRKIIRELRKLRAQATVQADSGPHRPEAQWESQHHWEGMPAEVRRAVTELSSLVTDLERTAKALDAQTLRNASDLLTSCKARNSANSLRELGRGLFPSRASRREPVQLTP